MPLKINLFGAPYIERDGEDVTVDTRKAIAILAYVIVTNTRQSRDTLATLLWEESDTRSAKAALRRTLSTLNKALESDCLVIERRDVVFEQNEDVWVDVIQFEALLTDVEAHQHDTNSLCDSCIQQLVDACDLYSDHFMLGFGLRDSIAFDNWQVTQSEYFQRRLTWALSQLVEALAVRQHYDAAIEYANLWLEIDPLHEATYRTLMKLYAWKGDRSSALQQYRACVRILDHELGVAPLEETIALYHQLQDNSLEKKQSTQVPQSSSRPQTYTQPKMAFVGRQQNLQQLSQVYMASRQQQRIVIVEGEQGIGKSRLLHEFIQSLSHDKTVILVKCFANETNLAYSLIVNILRQMITTKEHSMSDVIEHLSPSHRMDVARLLPDVIMDFEQSDTLTRQSSEISRIRLFEAITEFVRQCVHIMAIDVILVDDIHWSDDASSHLLSYVLQRLQDVPVMVVFARTPGLEQANNPINNLLIQQQRIANVLAIPLERLNQDAVNSWVSEITSSDLAQRLYQETEGLPLFIHEYLTLLQAYSHLEDDVWQLPVNIRDSLLFRINNLSKIEHQLLASASVIGQSFNFDLLQSISGRSEEEVINGIELLLQRGLITETRANTARNLMIVYDFYHNKLRTILYDDLSFARRKLIHRRVAQHLYDNAQRTTSPSRLGQIAYHYEQAREDDLAATLYFDAANMARLLYAHREALDYYEHSLALGNTETAAIHYGIGQVYAIQGQYSRAIRHYEIATSQSSDALVVRIERRMAQVYQRLGQWKIAEQHFARAFEGTRQGDKGLASLILTDWCLIYIRLKDSLRAMELAQQSLSFAIESQNKQALAQAYNILGIIAREQADYRQAIDHLEKSVLLASQSQDVTAHIAALNNMARAHLINDQLAIALESAEKAVELCQKIGARHQEAALYSNIGDILFRMNRVGEAEDFQKRSAKILSEIDRVDGIVQPEIWKLVEW